MHNSHAPILRWHSIGVADMSTEVLSRTYIVHKANRKADGEKPLGMPIGFLFGVAYLFGIGSRIVQNPTPTGIPLIDAAIGITPILAVPLGAVLDSVVRIQTQHLATQERSMARAAYWHTRPEAINDNVSSLLLRDARYVLKPDSRNISAVKRELRNRGIKPHTLLPKK